MQVSGAALISAISVQSMAHAEMVGKSPTGPAGPAVVGEVEGAVLQTWANRV
jgi:hypothetical protein